MKTASNFKACVNKCVIGAYAPPSKCNVGCWRAAALSQITVMSILSQYFYFSTFLAQDVFQPTIKAKLRTVCCRNMLFSFLSCTFTCSLPAGVLAQVGKAWDESTSVWELNRPCICHWSRTQGQLSWAAGDPGSPGEYLLLFWQEPHSLQVCSSRFQGKLPPRRTRLKACVIKSRCYVFSN